MGKMMLELQVQNASLNADNRRLPQMQELGLVTLVLKQDVEVVLEIDVTYMEAALDINMTGREAILDMRM